ncbi:siderophore-interacting protein [Corynebacterium pseudodiphtheriticum]|uniref:siderophore-interacting protein n=1 Tax=Corynebacterium pseudodiphtheriticum TaxID=37637 RepID=UPI002550180B|nr:siderophore-interacting protein [Corynebacterium pseudodiphtheriticum]MDK8613954.1 siderophore-interacting protein [Corynebacterium pseudodiphtheriticum]MDK8737890.1 siderophore-interacting protein [Corynebacterium pseudodiphtheriticum]MDK8744176.1 siderophore-interacting protein [Corynebacterium pseudodiphtheriticum]
MARTRTSYPASTRFLQVLRVQDVTDGMRRVTLGGPQLAAHTADNGYVVPEFRSDNFDDSIKLILPQAPGDEPVGPTQRDRKLDWPAKSSSSPRRTYTVRRFDSQHGELDVDFVLHGSGPATSWASQAQPGDILQIAGPKSTSSQPQGADWILAAGDATALPALSRWLEEWPAGQRGKFFILVNEHSHRQQLPCPDGVEITWLFRSDGHTLYDAISTTDWWDGEIFAWVAGESASLKPIRRWLQEAKGLRKHQIHFSGYWKSRTKHYSTPPRRAPETLASPSAHTATTNAAEPPQLTLHKDGHSGNGTPIHNAQAEFAALSDLTAAFAIRTAVTVGLGTTLAIAPRDVHELAAATNTQPAGLEKLLAYLETLGLVFRAAPAQWQLTASGRILAEDATVEQLSDNNQRNQTTLAGLVHLRTALVDGYHPGVTAAAGTATGLGTAAAPTETTDATDATNSVIPVTADLAQRDDAAATEYLQDLYRKQQQAGADSLRLACQCRLPDSTGETGVSAGSAASRSATTQASAERSRAQRSSAESALVTFALYGEQLRSREELYYLFGRAGLPAPTVGKHGSDQPDAASFVFEFRT